MSDGVWNHRVVKRVHVHDGKSTFIYALHEAHYHDRKHTRPYAITEDPIDVAVCLEEAADETDDWPTAKAQLKETLERMLRALELPVVLDGADGLEELK